MQLSNIKCNPRLSIPSLGDPFANAVQMRLTAKSCRLLAFYTNL